MLSRLPNFSIQFQSLSRDSVCLDFLDDAPIWGDVRFQSLSRDSVCLDADGSESEQVLGGVSIPESGFCLFGPLLQPQPT